MKIRVMAPINFPVAAPKFFGVVVQIVIVTEMAANRDNLSRSTHHDSLIASKHS
jgi:hypothetical protein